MGQREVPFFIASRLANRHSRSPVLGRDLTEVDGRLRRIGRRAMKLHDEATDRAWNPCKGM
jgi:hypothetical protein